VTLLGENFESISWLPVKNLIVADFPEPLFPTIKKLKVSNIGDAILFILYMSRNYYLNLIIIYYSFNNNNLFKIKLIFY
jgi:hypothetical protein